jgi:hypothetical protein
MNDVTVKEPRALDEFADWTDEAESGGEHFSERSIVGQLLRFSNDAHWLLPDKTELTKSLLVVNVRRTVVKWNKDKGPPETTFLKAGEKFPDLKALNEATPKAEWITDFNGNPKGPWEPQHLVYMIDPVSIDQYTFPTSTIGGSIAVRELVDRIMWMRRFRGNAVYPIVRLATRFMKTRFAGRLIPRFEITDWTKIEPGSGAIPVSEPPQLTQQPAEPLPAATAEQTEKLQTVLHAMGAQSVAPPTRQEEMTDVIPW